MLDRVPVANTETLEPKTATSRILGLAHTTEWVGAVFGDVFLGKVFSNTIRLIVAQTHDADA